MKAVNGEWTEEFIWHKKNCYPGKWPNRFRDAWERCLQFNKTKQFNMYQEAVMVPMGDWTERRLKHLSETDQIRDTSKVGSGFGKNVSNWLDRQLAYPTNVLHLATETGNRKHSVVFPRRCPNGSLSCLRKKTIGCLTRLPVQGRRVKLPKPCQEIPPVLKFCPNIINRRK